MDGTSEVPTVVNQGVGKATEWSCTSARHMYYRELTLSSLGPTQEHCLIQRPGHGGPAVLERGGCFRYLETF
jgi:hypothetical protein